MAGRDEIAVWDPGASAQGESLGRSLKVLALGLAEACLDCQWKALEAHRWALTKASHGAAAYRGASYAFLQCQKACATLAEACLSTGPLSVSRCRDCARVCEDCAAEAERLKDLGLRDFAESCRMAASACRETLSSVGTAIH